MQFHFLTTLKRKRLSYLILFFFYTGTLSSVGLKIMWIFGTSFPDCTSTFACLKKMGLTSQSPTEFWAVLRLVDAFSLWALNQHKSISWFIGRYFLSWKKHGDISQMALEKGRGFLCLQAAKTCTNNYLGFVDVLSPASFTAAAKASPSSSSSQVYFT